VRTNDLCGILTNRGLRDPFPLHARRDRGCLDERSLRGSRSAAAQAPRSVPQTLGRQILTFGDISTLAFADRSNDIVRAQAAQNLIVIPIAL
jgi:hypothetical protein